MLPHVVSLLSSSNGLAKAPAAGAIAAMAAQPHSRQAGQLTLTLTLPLTLTLTLTVTLTVTVTVTLTLTLTLRP